MMEHRDVYRKLVIHIDILQLTDIRGLAVITLVKVVGKNLPIESPIESVRMVENVIIEIEILESVLLVNVKELFFPWHFRYWGRVEVDPYKT